MSAPSRHFPPPWHVDEGNGCFIVRDHDGRPLAHVHFEEDPRRRTTADKLTRDEALRIASNIAKLPKTKLLRRP